MGRLHFGGVTVGDGGGRGGGRGIGDVGGSQPGGQAQSDRVRADEQDAEHGVAVGSAVRPRR
jgi:hypothetical protein